MMTIPPEMIDFIHNANTTCTERVQKAKPDDRRVVWSRGALAAMPCRRKWAWVSGGVAAAGLRCGGDRDAVGDDRVAGNRRGHPGARGSDLRVRPLGELLGARRGPSCSHRRTVRPHRRTFADGGGAPAA